VQMGVGAVGCAVGERGECISTTGQKHDSLAMRQASAIGHGWGWLCGW
jgi:hypothetical protein